jgi:hypothetical protein
MKHFYIKQAIYWLARWQATGNEQFAELAEAFLDKVETEQEQIKECLEGRR